MELPNNFKIMYSHENKEQNAGKLSRIKTNESDSFSEHLSEQTAATGQIEL